MKSASLITLALSQLILAVTVSALAQDDATGNKKLKSRHGYLIIHTDVGRKVANWKLNSKITIRELPIGEDFWLLELRAGDYQWQEIVVPSFDLPRRFDTSDNNRWKFTIKSGAINYAGTLVVGEERSRNNVDVRYLNRTAEVSAYVRENLAEKYALHGFIYSGPDEDRFLSLSGYD